MTPAKHPPKDVAASVRQRLLNLSRARNVEFQLVLSEYAVERLLYRLGRSAYAEGFVLKGAMLFRLWFGDQQRATWDLDLQGSGENRVDDVTRVVEEVASADSNDGITFDVKTINGQEIQAADKYPGVRIRLDARLADARIPVQIDVGFGDVITPSPTSEKYPTLLDHPAPEILVYPRETVVAQKLEAMISLGVTTSRMKDFYDVHVLASTCTFEGAPLTAAVAATFERRETPIPADRPAVLTREFLDAPVRRTQWRAFLRRGRLSGPESAEVLADELWIFAGPIFRCVAGGDATPGTWPAGGPWSGGSR